MPDNEHSVARRGSFLPRLLSFFPSSLIRVLHACVCRCGYADNSRTSASELRALDPHTRKTRARSPLWVTHRRSESRDLTLVWPLLRTLVSYNSRRTRRRAPPRKRPLVTHRAAKEEEKKERKRKGKERKPNKKKAEISSPLPRKTPRDAARLFSYSRNISCHLEMTPWLPLLD